MNIPPKWLALAGDLLDMASDKFANHGCNDYHLPDDWSDEERRELMLAMEVANGTPEEFDPDQRCLSDWWAMAFLADVLRESTAIRDMEDRKAASA